jgi:hypothetical protein
MPRWRRSKVLVETYAARVYGCERYNRPEKRTKPKQKITDTTETWHGDISFLAHPLGSLYNHAQINPHNLRPGSLVGLISGRIDVPPPFRRCR